MNKLGVSLLLVLASLAVAQSAPPPSVTQSAPPQNAHKENIPITDLSPAGSPVKFTGQPVACFEWEENSEVWSLGDGAYHMTNISGRTIVAIIGSTEEACSHTGGQDGNGIWHDFFGKPSGLLPDQALDIPINISMGMGLHDGKPFDFTTPSYGRIKVKALWAQFDDGSQWGDTAAGQELLKQRVEKLQFYQRLATESDEPSKLLATLEETAPLSEHERLMLHTLNRYRSEYGLPAVILMIKEKVRIATERMATGKF